MQRFLITSVFAILCMLMWADYHHLTVCEYWLDVLEGSPSTVSMTQDVNMSQFVVDASACNEGLHQLFYRVKDSDGNYSRFQQWLFYRIVPKVPAGYSQLEYWIDDGEPQTYVIEGQNVSVLADASALGEGVHRINYRLKNSEHNYSTLHTWLFYKTNHQPKATSLKWYRVWWNDHEDKAIEVQLPNGTAEYLYEETLAVPEYARGDAFSYNSKAVFHVTFCDDQGHLLPVESAEVPYPDIYPPYTKLTASLNADGVALQWTANKDNVRDYNVYYSENDEPYVLWKANVLQTQTVFCGQQGKSYSFIVTARDDKGNYEAMEESKAVKVDFK